MLEHDFDVFFAFKLEAVPSEISPNRAKSTNPIESAPSVGSNATIHQFSEPLASTSGLSGECLCFRFIQICQNEQRIQPIDIILEHDFDGFFCFQIRTRTEQHFIGYNI